MEESKKLGQEYMYLREQESLIKKRKKEIGDKIKKLSESKGQIDENGSYYLDTEGFVLGKQARTSIKINLEKAKEFFAGKGIWDSVKIIKEDVDEEKVEELLNTGDLTQEELEDIVDKKTTYAVEVRAVDDEEAMPKVENSKKKPVFKKTKK